MKAAVFFLVLSSAMAAEERGKVSSGVEEDLAKAASNLDSKAESKAEDRIIGGEFVPAAGLPWQVGAAFHDWMSRHSNYYLKVLVRFAKKGRAFKCGGAIISKKFVLSAAH